ncbi:MAG: HNH endonuclease family protein [Oscillospiraceae bacterium]
MDLEIKTDKVFTDKREFTISALSDMLRDGDIKTDTDYQREYVYDNKKASLLVESILMGIPIPVLYLSEEEDSSYEVIDGQQRILSFVRYYNNEFALKLEKGSTFEELDGKKFKELDKALQRKYKQSSLSAIVILKESNSLKYDIFERLNQGSIQLKPQEIRNCIYRGTFNTMLKDIVKENKNELSELFKDENKRMDYEEQILKFFTMLSYRYIKAPFYKAMNKYMSIHSNDDDKEIKKLKKKFLDTFRLVKQVLGKEAFSSYNHTNGKIIRSFNSSIYDSIMVSFASFRKQDIINNADKIKIAIEDIKNNNLNYDDCIHRGTNSGIKTSTRIEIIYNAIKKIVEQNSLNIYDSRCFTEEQKKELFYDGCKCGVCGQKILNFNDCEVDHIIPYSKGGRTILENAQLVHSYCNKSKGNQLHL